LDSKGSGFSRSFGRKIGDGKTTKMWMERWLGNESFQEEFPRLFQLEENKEALIADRGDWSDD